MNDDIVNKFTTHLKNVLTKALCFVVESNQASIMPEHLLWALGTQKGSIGAEILHKVKVKPESLRRLAGASVKGAKNRMSPDMGGPLLSEDSKRVIEKAVLTASVYDHQYVGTEHLLSGLMQAGIDIVDGFFTAEQIDTNELRQQIAIVLKSTSKFPEIAGTIGQNSPGPITAGRDAVEQLAETRTKKTPALDFFGRDLTSGEIQNDIDPVIGREAEIERMMEVLSRRTKNNPLLLGDPGVGKTAIVEGLAKRVLEGNVPEPLKGKRIIQLDLAVTIAGTMYRGEFEGRIRQIVEEAKENEHIILFIDEVHTIIGAGAASGSLDAANILKPALARGEIRCIGATTPTEFKKHIETDPALERRFQTVIVDEPSEEKTLEILRGIRQYYESFHSVEISEEALQAAVRFSVRYLQDKNLPDKAIDLIDEASASTRVKSETRPQQGGCRNIERELAEIRDDKRLAVAEERFTDAIELKEAEKRLIEKWREQKQLAKDEPRQVIREQDIAGIISRMTKIPLAELMDTERKRLSKLEEILQKSVIGQEQAVSQVAGAIRRAKTGISDPARPLASFLFLGPSGVGKTELARTIGNVVFSDEKALIRLDMSEFSESFTASKLIGSPAGYVGYREGTKLSDQIKQKPHSVVLFDELEKAHTDVQNLLLQILEEGEISDATGRIINFKNTIIVMTSNIGLERLQNGGLGFVSDDQEENILQQDLRKELEERFRPELINRVDNVCIFKKLGGDSLRAIAEKQLNELAERIKEKKIAVEIADSVYDFLAEAAIESKLGAREIRRLINTEVEPKIAERLLKNRLPKNLQIETRKGGLVILARKA